MKLSEALRIGASKRPQAFGAMYRDGGTCAMGAIFEGFGAQFNELGSLKAPMGCYVRLAVERDIRQKFSTCPVGFGCKLSRDNLHINIQVIIVHLNDYHKLTREAIAEWVETFENKIEQEKQDAEQSRNLEADRGVVSELPLGVCSGV